MNKDTRPQAKDDISKLKSRSERERKSRKQAESLLEQKSRELFDANQELKLLAENLEQVIEVRTRDLIETRDKALVALRTREQFLSNISHELRTPMNGVLGSLAVLMNTKLDVQQRNLLKTAISSGHLMTKIINDILDYTNLEKSEVDLVHAEFCPAEEIALVLEMFAEQALQKNLQILNLNPPDLPYLVMGDATRFSQILFNLMSNAIKFTHEGHIICRTEFVNGCLVINIEDTGIGMSDQQMDRVFEDFAQADDSSTRQYGGTGLGLTISKNLIELMDGFLSVESVENHGSTFSVHLSLEVVTTCNIEPVSEAVRHHPIATFGFSKAITENLIEHFRHWGFSKVRNFVQEADLRRWIKDNSEDGLLLCAQYCDGSSFITDTNCSLVQYQPTISVHHPNEKTFLLSSPVNHEHLKDALKYLLEGQQDRQTVTTDSELPSFNGETVLLVEDNPVNQEVAINLLKRVNLKVKVANDGIEALEMVGEPGIALVLMDIHMPNLDGIEATKRIRSSRRDYADIPIVAMTAYGLTGDKEKCLLAGMNDHVAKPVAPKNLYDAIDTYLIKDTAPSQTSIEDEPIVEEQNNVATSTITVSGIDVLELQERMMLNDASTLRILSIFESQYQNFESQLSSLISNNDDKGIMALLHTLKGSSGNICAKDIYQSVVVLEKHLKEAFAKDGPELTPHVDELTALADAVGELIANLRNLNSNEGNDKEKSTIDKSQLLEKVILMQENLYQDLGLIGDILNELEQFQITDESASLLKQLSTAFNEFDYDEMESAIEQLITINS